MRITPTQDFVVVQTEEPKRTTPGGILLPDPKERRPDRGVVFAVGPGLWTESGVRNKPDLRIGDVVWFPRPVGTDLESGGVWFRILRASEILAAVSPT